MKYLEKEFKDMPILSMSMKVAINQNRKWRWIPDTRNGFNLDYIASKGGEVRCFRSGQNVENEMIIGSEFAEAKMLGNFIIGRFSDGFSLDLANISRTQELITVGASVFAGSRLISLVMNSAKITWFERSMAKGKNYERIKFSFDSKNAEIKYDMARDAVVKV